MEFIFMNSPSRWLIENRCRCHLPNLISSFCTPKKIYQPFTQLGIRIQFTNFSISSSFFMWSTHRMWWQCIYRRRISGFVCHAIWIGQFNEIFNGDLITTSRHIILTFCSSEACIVYSCGCAHFTCCCLESVVATGPSHHVNKHICSQMPHLRHSFLDCVFVFCFCFKFYFIPISMVCVHVPMYTEKKKLFAKRNDAPEVNWIEI